MSLAQSATRALGGDWHGHQGLAPMPGHTPIDRGLSIKDSDSGDDILLHSFSDDAFNKTGWRDLKDTLRASGILPAQAAAPDRDRETGCYEYADETGTVLYRTKRIERTGKAKRFVAERLSGNVWSTKMGEVRRIPYRLPDIIAAPDATIYLVEGERKADKLASWGLVATAIAFGANGWADRHGYAEHFRGRTVVLLPDNDQPGREFADRVRTSINRVGKAIVLELPGLPPKGDIMDWTGNADELRALTDAALNPPVEYLPLSDIGLWATTPRTAKSFAMEGFIPEREVTLFTGAGGTNKSTFGLQLCACSAMGLPMLGMSVVPGPALYVTAEDEDRENHWRLSKISEAVRVPLERLAGRLHVASLRGRLNNELATFDSEGRIKPAPTFALLRATIEQTGSKLVVLDNVGHLYIGNENDRGQVTAFINLLYRLCLELNVTIVLIGHPNKQFLQGNQDGNQTSGSTAWLNAVRSQLLIQRPTNNPDPDVRELTLGKANYARPDQTLAFRWHDFALILDHDLTDERRAELQASIATSSDNSAFLECLRERERQGDGRQVGPSPGPNYAPSQFKGMAQAKGVSPERLKLAMDRLFTIGAIQSHTFRNTAKGRDVTVIRESETAPRTPTPNPSRTPPEPFPERHPNPSLTTPHTHSIPKGISGAASGPAAPFLEEQKRPVSRVCFPMTDAEAFEAEAWRDD